MCVMSIISSKRGEWTCCPSSKGICIFTRSVYAVLIMQNTQTFPSLKKRARAMLKSWIDSEKTDLSTKKSSCLYTHHCHIATFSYILDTAGLSEMLWNQCNSPYKSDGLEVAMVSPLRRYMSWNLPPFPRARVPRHFPEIGVFGAY